MPTVGDVLKASVTFNDSVGGVMENVYTLKITSLTGTEWQDVATDVANWLVDLYDPWMTHVSVQITSRDLTISLRDEALGQWNEVWHGIHTGMNGLNGSDSLPPINCGTVVGYPASKRHRGFKNLPAPAEDAVENGSLDASAFASLGLFLIDYVLPIVGAYGGYDVGTITLATNIFRRFVGEGAITNVVGSRTTRKEGRGI